MTSFEDLFMESGGQPVEYKGLTLYMVDRFPVDKQSSFKVVVEDANDDWREGIHISTVGHFEVNGTTIKDAVVLWVDTAPREVEITAKSESGVCLIKNVWDPGDGVMHSWHAGAAMIIEETESGRRYSCNDGRENEDFSDIVFRIEK